MNDTALDNLRQKLVFRRNDLGLSFAEIAKEANMSETTICRFHNDGNSLDTDNRLKLGAWLNMSAAEVFGNKKTVESCSDEILESIRKLILSGE